MQNGDIVEIITSKNAHPSRDWLNVVATTSAKNRIRQWFKKERRDENIIRGREALEREMGRTGLEQMLRSDKALEVAQKFNNQTVDDLLAAIGYGELGAMQVLNRLRPEPEKALPPETVKELPRKDKAKSKNGILVDGSDSMMVNIAKCCSPVPGEPVMGTVTRGRGITVHSTLCPNLAATAPERQVTVEWADASVQFFPVEIEIELLDRVGLLKDISAKIADIKTNIRAAKIRTLRDKSALINLIVDISDVQHLERVLSTIARVSDVMRAYRVTKLRQGSSQHNSKVSK
jgi:(p)ppGpp synthase/HD superfamily hydrolase